MTPIDQNKSIPAPLPPELHNRIQMNPAGFPLIPSPAFATAAGTPYLRAPGVALLAKPQIDVDNLADFLGGFAPELHFTQYLDDPTPLTPASQLCKSAGQLCFDADTEVLTDRGWALFSQLRCDDKVLTLNPITNYMVYEAPQVFHAFEYRGNMKRFAGRDVSFKVTPDHRQWGFFSRRGETVPRFVETRSIDTDFSIRTHGGEWEGYYPDRICFPEIQWEQQMSNHTNQLFGVRGGTVQHRPLIEHEDIFAFAQLCTFYATEGSLHKSGGAGITIYGDHVNEVAKLCEQLCLKYSVHTDKRNNVERVNVGGGRSFMSYFEQSCGHLSENKRLPRWVLNLPKSELERIWQILIDTDGYRSHREGHQSRDIFVTTSMYLVDQLQEISVKCSFSATYTMGNLINDSGKKPVFYVHRKLPRLAHVHRKVKITDEPYDGIVYCVTTGNGIIYVRRDGKAHWSGNCYMSFAPRRTLNSDADRYFRNIKESGHGSVLEHANFTFLFYGVSRSLTHELVRHRLFSFSQVSQRYVSGRVLRFVERPEYAADPELHTAFERRIDRSAADYEQVAQRLLAQQKEGAELLSADAKTDLRKKVQQAARSLLPNETEAPIVVTGNVRAWRHFLEMRASAHAEVEIRALAFAVYLCLVTVEPLLFEDYRIVVLPDSTYAVETELMKV